jgi:hypothetical protein
MRRWGTLDSQTIRSCSYEYFLVRHVFLLPESVFDNPVHKAVSRGSDRASKAENKVQVMSKEFKRMFNPLYVIECH